MTTNNLIGYDPLAWMDGEVIEDTPPPAPAKKPTKAKAKAAQVETVEEPPVPVVADKIAEEEPVATEETHADLSTVTDEDNSVELADEIEMEVAIDKDGDIQIEIDADENTHLTVEISVETTHSDDDVIDQIVEEVSEMSAKEAAVEETVATISEKVVEPVHNEEVVEPLITLESDATIKKIAELYEIVKRALAAHDRLEIDASDVKTIDTATLQLLVSLKKDAPNLHKTIDIIYPSPRFIESAKLLDLLTVLEVTEA